MLGARVIVQGDKTVATSLKVVARSIRDFRPLWNRIELDFYGIMDEQFAGQGVGPAGKWKVLSPAYERRKAQAFPGRMILERTGELMDSLTVKGHSSRMLRKTESEMEIGTSIPYADFHQRGGPIIPRRALIDLTEEHKRGWEDIAREWVGDVIREAGL